ncbi:MAG: cupin domain-containing protein [Mojavia pulchra JT2-VF2]|jgi:quercetin dioxygenase-like cupin family protein|uniref:Cupin domain-containing protein n=1 Tax=Mojavia pulchra JT2-VF2 TaxID=287848 RepID=A0A951UEI3_9NOST|nr:cupin domain-containing protein [Mojavia pulchra JT2-VF2]
MAAMKKLSMVIAGAAFSASCLGLEPVRASHTFDGELPHRQSNRPVVKDYLVVPPDPNIEGYYEPSGGLYNILVDSKQTQGTSTLFNFLIPPGGGTIPHTHHRDDEVFYVLSGNLSVLQINDNVETNLTAGPGGFVYLPQGRPHSFSNQGTETVSTLSFFAPGGIENFFRFIGRPKQIGPGGPDFTYDNIVQQYPEEFAKIQFSLPVTNPGAKDFVVVESQQQVGPVTSLVTKEQTTAGRFSAAILSLEPELEMPLQTQSSDGQLFYALSSGFAFQLGNHVEELVAGSAVYIAPNTPYSLMNAGLTAAKLLSFSITTPVPEPTLIPSLVVVALGLGVLRKKYPSKRKQAVKIEAN